MSLRLRWKASGDIMNSMVETWRGMPAKYFHSDKVGPKMSI